MNPLQKYVIKSGRTSYRDSEKLQTNRNSELSHCQASITEL